MPKKIKTLKLKERGFSSEADSTPKVKAHNGNGISKSK